MRSPGSRQEIGGFMDMESQGNQEQDTKTETWGVTGVLRVSVMGPLRSRQVREIGHWESLGKQRDRVIEMSIGSLRVRGVR